MPGQQTKVFIGTVGILGFCAATFFGAPRKKSGHGAFDVDRWVMSNACVYLSVSIYNINISMIIDLNLYKQIWMQQRRIDYLDLVQQAVVIITAIINNPWK